VEGNMNDLGDSIIHNIMLGGGIMPIIAAEFGIKGSFSSNSCTCSAGVYCVANSVLKI
jgi:3-oxoacyl-(acyl-carrier-protein) synthase